MTDATVLQFPGKGKALPEIVSAKSDMEMAIPRDRWDRPMIIPADGGEPVAYRRASTVAEVIPDHFGLSTWRERTIAFGLARRPDLVQALHTATKKEVAAIMEEAFNEGGGGVAARNGTTMHRLTDVLDGGGTVPKGLPRHIVAMLDAYAAATARFEVLDSEKFVVQDKIKVAGTYDRRVLDKTTGLRLIGDLKTSQKLEYHTIKTPAQVAVYAAGLHYELDGEREAHGADRNLGVLIWLPWTEDVSDARCELRWLDLRTGRAAIRKAFEVEELRKMTVAQNLPPMH